MKNAFLKKSHDQKKKKQKNKPEVGFIEDIWHSNEMHSSIYHFILTNCYQKQVFVFLGLLTRYKCLFMIIR